MFRWNISNKKCRRNRFFGDATCKPIDFENSEGNLGIANA
jgi:hypothetical protein